MAITTFHCKTFLVDFVKDNPSIILSIYGYHKDSAEAKSIINDALNPKKWVRRYKCNPGKGLYEFEEYRIFTKSQVIVRMGYDILPKMPASNFVSERGFYLDLDTYDSGISLAVIEDKNGQLHLGDYIGD